MTNNDNSHILPQEQNLPSLSLETNKKLSDTAEKFLEVLGKQQIDNEEVDIDYISMTNDVLSFLKLRGKTGLARDTIHEIVNIKRLEKLVQHLRDLESKILLLEAQLWEAEDRDEKLATSKCVRCDKSLVITDFYILCHDCAVDTSLVDKY